jgi:hypothetical protein
MSMNAHYRALSARLALRLRDDPALVRAAIDADAGDPELPGVPPALRSLMESLPDEVRGRLDENAALQEQIKRNAATHERAAADAATALSTAGFDLGDVRDALDTAKAWHGLHFLLAGAAWATTAPPGDAVLGGCSIGEDLGYGPARVMRPDEVKETALALKALTVEEFRKRFDADAMAAAEIYGGRWKDAPDEELAWLVDAFEEVQRYFVEASERGDGMLLYLM